LVWVPARNLEYAHKQILEFEQANGKRKDEEEEYDSMKEEEEEVNKPVVEKKKSKKSTGQKEKRLLSYKPKKLHQVK
jgi:hypothetical protein